MPAPIQKVLKPEGLSPIADGVWDLLAKHAIEQGTLVPATAFEFRETCELAAQQAKARAAFDAEGLTEFGLKLEKAYRGLTQRLETKLRAFKLAPMGKEIAQPDQAKPKSALDRLKEQRSHLHAV